MSNHRTVVIRSFEELLKDVGLESEEKFNESFPRHDRQKYEHFYNFWKRVWAKHVKSHGNKPMIRKCKICSGEEFRQDIKKGRWKISTREDSKDPSYVS